VNFVSHAGGDWQMYCDDKAHDFNDPKVLKNDLALVHVAHLLAKDGTLEEIADLPIDVGAERDYVGGPWIRFEDKDDD
jgi:hypothetical protein